jgi:arylsulfate sulfotransferase
METPCGDTGGRPGAPELVYNVVHLVQATRSNLFGESAREFCKGPEFVQQGCTQMKKSRAVLCLSAAVLFTVASLGCGSGNFTPPLSAVAQTSHPLVAQYSVMQVQQGTSVWVEFGPDTNYGRQTSVTTATSPGPQTVPILVAGMKPQTAYHMRAHATWTGGSWVDQDQTFTTGALPSSEPPPAFQVASLPPVPGVTPAPGVELLDVLSLTGAHMLQAVALDLQGNVIWYCPQGTIPIKLMPNGHFILNTGTDLVEVDLTCSTIRDVSVTQVNESLQANGYDFTIPPPLGLPGGSPFHHDVLVLPNGDWIGLCQITKTFPNLTGYPNPTQVVGDALVDIDLNGNVVWAWNSFDYLDPNRHPYFGLPDWTHSNAIVYTPDGNLLLSMRAQSWVLKLDYANGTGAGDILWQLGPSLPGDVGNFFTLSGGDPTQWFYSQHYPNLLSMNGPELTLAVMDNGDYRTDSSGVQCETTPTAPACYSRAAIFQVDESTYVASVLWEDLPGFYSTWGGSAGVLSNGNVEFDMTTLNGAQASQIMEVTQTGSPQTVWQLNITGENAYRGFRIPSLYPGVTWQQ